MGRINKNAAAVATEKGLQRFHLLETFGGQGRIANTFLKDLRKASATLSEVMSELLEPEKAETLGVLCAWIQETEKRPKAQIRKDLLTLAKASAVISHSLSGRLQPGRPQDYRLYRLVYCVATEWQKAKLPVSASKTSAIVNALLPVLETISPNSAGLESVAARAISSWKSRAK